MLNKPNQKRWELLLAFLVGFILDSFLHSAPAACGTAKGTCHTVFRKNG